ncbi:hypothetical protein [Streptomyces albidoflavus]|uniref:hypothetical protein n=1 Tax=Streptomyces albidoflavus TaxID=1886 RepID=UPI0033C069C3
MTTNPSSPREALAHVLATFADEPDTGMAVVATRNQPVRGAVTGLTWGDLRALAAELADRPTRAEVLRETAPEMDAIAHEYGVFGVGSRLRQLADDAEAGEPR